MIVTPVLIVLMSYSAILIVKACMPNTVVVDDGVPF
jgi:hypothetical protein